MSSHKLTSYRASLVEVLKAQIKSERVEPGLEGVIELAESVALKASFACHAFWLDTVSFVLHGTSAAWHSSSTECFHVVYCKAATA